MMSMLATKMPGKNYQEVIPRIYIGNRYSPRDESFIRGNSINLIICASNDQTDIMNYGPNVTTVFVKDFSDIDYVDAGNLHVRNIANMFRTRSKAERAATIIGTAYSNGGNILIHCAAGINRSALIIGMFMINHLGYSYSDTMHLLSAANVKRSPLLPVLTNQTFRAMLLG